MDIIAYEWKYQALSDKLDEALTELAESRETARFLQGYVDDARRERDTARKELAQLIEALGPLPRTVDEAHREIDATRTVLIEADDAITALAGENQRLREWIKDLDVLAENTGDRREWNCGGIGWVNSGDAVYYGPRREGVL
jgi:chromosome segregation ATPase